MRISSGDDLIICEGTPSRRPSVYDFMNSERARDGTFSARDIKRYSGSSTPRS